VGATETIYQSLYVQSRGALRRDLATCLRTGQFLETAVSSRGLGPMQGIGAPGRTHRWAA